MENTNIDLASLSQHFTEEELATVLPKDEAESAEVVEEQAEQQEVEQTEEPSQPDSDIVQEEKPQKLKPTVIAYDRFKEVNDKAKALAAELAALKAQKPEQQPTLTPQPVQPEPVNMSAQRAKYYESLTKDADREAREILGIDATEDIASLQFTDAVKYQVYLNAMTSIVQEKDSQNKQAWKLQQDTEQFVARIQSDPLFPQVYKFIDDSLDDLPTRETKKINDALQRIGVKRGTKKDFALIEETYNTYKEKFIALTGAEKQPVVPQIQANKVASPLDKAEGLPRASNLSGAKTAAMSWQQVEQLIRDGKADQIPKEMLAQIDPKLIE